MHRVIAGGTTQVSGGSRGSQGVFSVSLNLDFFPARSHAREGLVTNLRQVTPCF